ncbi:MAG: hypothetical protein E7Z87_01510 [Cyanobacteria bacterium SIG26]|nr:hypothetical protein [Cyanobacteria bacterium SIG26]
MRVNSITNYNLDTIKSSVKNNKINNNIQKDITFTADDKNASKALRNTIIGCMLLPVAGGVVTGCDDYVDAYAHVEITGDSIPSHKKDSASIWRETFARPIPLDSIYNNFDNWAFGDGDKNDPKSNRNIIHYEGTREWEYMTREVGDINLTDFPNNKNVLVYDTEIFDWKGNHESYGKQIIKIPQTSFTLTTKDGKTLYSPKGFFVEHWENDLDEKGASLNNHTKISSAFCQTNGKVLNVAKLGEGNNYIQTGSVEQGYLGDNSILLNNLIGVNPTDDHYTGVDIKTVNDSTLREIYVDQMMKKF